jgi:protein ImuB
MNNRYVSIWFRHLPTDWFALREPSLHQKPFVLRTSSRGRMIIAAANAKAELQGICKNMALADARALVPALHVLDDVPDLIPRLLRRLAEWCIRFTPTVAIDFPDGLLLDATGCSHLWGGDVAYVDSIEKRLQARGYDVRVAMADTVRLAWGVARFAAHDQHVVTGQWHLNTLMQLPPEALRLEPETVERLHKLGLHKVQGFINLPRTSLRRRFGTHLLTQLDRALGNVLEMLEPVVVPQPYSERLPCLEPIVTLTGIEIALQQLLEKLCLRLQRENKGIRQALLKCYRVDGKMVSAQIGTHRPSYQVSHLFKLFETKLSALEPDMGIELFLLEAPHVEDHFATQNTMWGEAGGLEDPHLAELIDRLFNKFGVTAVRYLPAEHYWPERSFKTASSLTEMPATAWRTDKVRPIHLLLQPASVEVVAPVPDYPPILFIYKSKVHHITKADGPERIEQEWWIQQGEHRDYYLVEDEQGNRYWIFRLGHYHHQKFQWFLHGYFA